MTNKLLFLTVEFRKLKETYVNDNVILALNRNTTDIVDKYDLSTKIEQINV